LETTALNNKNTLVVASLIALSILTWLVSFQQYDTMMTSMMTVFNPISLAVFATIWTAGMAAMMFPAIIPMVLMYKRLVTKDNGLDKTKSFLMHKENESNTSQNCEKKLTGFYFPSLRIILFVLSYLFVWAVTGIALLVGWSLLIDFLAPYIEHFMMTLNANKSTTTNAIYGILLLISGIYQFSPLKKKCLGYCESPFGFFSRRWKEGNVGALTMGMYHGLYCLGCCWPYFLLMVALGWMNVLWMGVFATIIFTEKIWIKGGLWIARLTGVAFLILGILTMTGFVTLGSHNSMSNEMGVMTMDMENSEASSNSARNSEGMTESIHDMVMD
jgi:predicted metal-binding membrane protein